MMGTQEAREVIRERYMDLGPDKFEQFSKIITEQVEGPAYIRLTPFQDDKGLDLEGDIGHGFIEVRFGGQVKQYTNTINGPSIQTFVGSLNTNDCDVGCFITSSTYSEGAIERAEESNIPLTLVDGDDILGIMLEHEVGITQPDPDISGEFELDPKFWEIFDATTGDELIPSDKVPQANNVEVLNVVLKAIDMGYRYKPAIRDQMQVKTGQAWQVRQADYYALAGWALNYVHKDTMGEYRNNKMRRFGLTRNGQEYVQLLREEKEEESQNHLRTHIREMEIIKRLLPKIREQSEVANDELVTMIFEEAALNETTAKRRTSTVRQWLMMLPEINRKRKNNTTVYEYLSDAERLV